MNYLSPILSACAIFPILALLITIPYVIYEYHKYGSINKLRVLIVYSFILYLLVAYFLVILPLPSIDVVHQMAGPKMQLVPFMFVVDIVKHVPLTILFFKYKEVYQVLFNLILTVPFGIYLRYYFKLGLRKVTLYSFLLSLFFELTQLSGLYFIYPRPYRLFDVDDLMINTLGGVVGYAIAKIFMLFLPSRDKIDLESYKSGRRVSIVRKITMFCLDWVFISILLILVSIGYSLLKIPSNSGSVMTVTLLIYYVIIPSIKPIKGQTYAGKLLNIKVVDKIGLDCKWYQYLIRYFFLYLILWGVPSLLIVIIGSGYSLLPKEYGSMFVILVFLMIFIVLIYWFINKLFNKKPHFYEKISKTKLVSTIIIPDELKESKK